jgi:hypothetical protein
MRLLIVISILPTLGIHTIFISISKHSKGLTVVTFVFQNVQNHLIYWFSNFNKPSPLIIL